DNDGDLDGVVAYGAFDVAVPNEDWDNPAHQPDALWLQQPDGSFEDAAVEWGVADPGKNRGIVVADFDGDGWLDLAKRDLGGPSLLYVSRCGRDNWIKVRLRDDAIANRNAVGARVRVVGADGVARSRWVTAGGTGYGTGGPPEVHVGLGDADAVDHVEVQWPDGTESWAAFGVPANQTVTIHRE
ncbi:MAG: CRTAC1 family protein, partial [Myxococcota bacterium]